MALLNLDGYKVEDYYSDGAVEDEVLEIVQQHRDVSSVLENDNRWPILYHFSPDRRNLLEWYPFRSDASLLEIGAGCGALTGLFCEKLAHVSAVELSEKRSRIIYHRYENAANLEVLAGNVMDISFSRSFDYVTLIGVLEYVKCFVAGPHPYRDMFNRISALLKPGGTLLLAIENKFGLKYFAGAREDHTGRSFDGLEGYLNGGRIETFSKHELIRLLGDSGYSTLRFYYPYPDYKLPEEIFSDACLPEINHILHDAPNFDQERLGLFSEKKALVNIIREGSFDFFSNSFLVIASRKP